MSQAGVEQQLGQGIAHHGNVGDRNSFLDGKPVQHHQQGHIDATTSDAWSTCQKGDHEDHKEERHIQRQHGEKLLVQAHGFVTMRIFPTHSQRPVLTMVPSTTCFRTVDFFSRCHNR